MLQNVTFKKGKICGRGQSYPDNRPAVVSRIGDPSVFVTVYVPYHLIGQLEYVRSTNAAQEQNNVRTEHNRNSDSVLYSTGT